MSNVNRRRFINFSIKKRMQARLLIGLMLVVLISVGLTSAFFYFFSSHEVGETYKQFHVNAKNFLEFLLPGVIIAFMIGLVSAIAVGVFIPHRIAGPLYRIERDIKDKVGEGNFKAKFSRSICRSTCGSLRCALTSSIWVCRCRACLNCFSKNRPMT